MARVSGDGQTLVHCTPCRHCFECIKGLGIRKIVFINEDGEIEAQRTKNMQATHVSLGNIILGKT